MRARRQWSIDSLISRGPVGSRFDAFMEGLPDGTNGEGQRGCRIGAPLQAMCLVVVLVIWRLLRGNHENVHPVHFRTDENVHCFVVYADDDWADHRIFYPKTLPTFRLGHRFCHSSESGVCGFLSMVQNEGQEIRGSSSLWIKSRIVQEIENGGKSGFGTATMRRTDAPPSSR